MMKRVKQWFRSPAATWTLFIAAVALLLFAGVGGTRAALNKLSDNYVAEVSMKDIGITLVENNSDVASRDYASDKKDGTWTGTVSGKLLGNMLGEGEQFAIGKPYDEQLAVKNSGTIGEYVRLTVNRYWLDEDGEKMTDLEPDLIQLYLKGKDLDKEKTAGSWVKDEKATTAERMVFYYTKALAPGETTSLLTDRLVISGELLKEITRETVEKDGKTIIYTRFNYNGAKYCLEVTADAVQINNAQQAILSAWGQNVSVSDSGLSLQ